VKAVMPANPLAPRRVRRRHAKMLPEGARERLLETAGTARDRLVITWLGDGGFRIGELCGLHLADLHLRVGATCGECRSAHVHVCHRGGNPNKAAAKTKHEWVVEDGTVRGGLIKRASPAMIHAYFEYMTTEYPKDAGHGMLLVQLHERRRAGLCTGRGSGDASAGRYPGGPWPGQTASIQALSLCFMFVWRLVTGWPVADGFGLAQARVVSLWSSLMILSFFLSQGWESWDVERRPLLPERMPVLIDDDLRFEDGPGAPRPATVVNRWLRELPASGCPAPSSWESYARTVMERAPSTGPCFVKAPAHA